MKPAKSVAIIGSGISGLSAAYHLHKDYSDTIFEQQQRFGGHTDTHDLAVDGEQFRVDSGFIVFCEQYYPNFSNMLTSLGVASIRSDMSFSALNRESGLVYNATSLNKLFCQRRNLLRPRFYRMIADIIRFYRRAPAVLKQNDHETTVASYLQQKRYSQAFAVDHLYPMIGALWSATPARVAEFPIRHLVEFMLKHGMMKLIFRPVWRVVEGGSDNYIKALQDQLDCRWLGGQGVTSVSRKDDGVELVCGDDSEHRFDAVIFAAHADEVLAMLSDASEHEVSILGDMDFETNEVLVHTDETVLHPNRNAWASWNTEIPGANEDHQSLRCSATYWMNLLQSLQLKCNVFTTLNSSHKIDPDKVLAKRTYAHPVYTATSVRAQKRLNEINGKRHSYFVGAYWGWGFHEDGARSAQQTCQLLKQQLA